jgi:hypothetical protein
MIERKFLFKKIIYFSFKDISLGLMLFSNKDFVYGTKGRVTGIEINIIFLHIKLGIIKYGF